MMIEPFPLIEISGAPFERGVQYGQKAAGRIRKGTSHYFEQLKDLSLGDLLERLLGMARVKVEAEALVTSRHLLAEDIELVLADAEQRWNAAIE